MMFIPGMYSGGHWAEGSEDHDIHCQIIITSKGKIERKMHWVSYGPLPGIY
jgi:hypothetical protein